MHSIIKKLTLSAVLFFSVHLVFSQVPDVITVDKAVKMAAENNLTVRSEKYQLSAKRRSSRNRWNSFVPDITAGSAYSRANEKPVIGDYHWNLSSSIQAQLALSLSLFDGIKYLMLDYEAGQISYEDALKALERDVRKSFYNIILLRENISLLEENMKTAEKRYNQADINFRNGLVSELDKLQSQVSYEQLKPEYVELKNSYAKALLSFKQIIGLEKEADITLEGEIAPEDYVIEVNELIFTSLPNRLDIQKLIANIKLMKTSRDSVIHKDKFPSLLFTYQKNMVFLNDPLADPLFKDTENDWTDTGTFTISLSFDLDSYIPGFKTDTELKNREDEIKSLEAQLARTLQLAETEIRSYVMEIEKSRKKIEFLLMNEKLSERAYELAEEGYNAGTVELLTLESSSDDLQKARLNVLSEKYNYQAALLDLEYAINKSLEDVYEEKK